MKKVYNQLLPRIFTLVASMFVLSVSPTFAQIGNLGIYGSVPTALRASTVYAHIEPNDTDNAIGYDIPINGLYNFNFYYTHDGNGFLSGEHYTITYLDANKSSLGYEVVNYTPNDKRTNGTPAANPFYSPPSYPLGVHGYVLAKIPGGGGATAPLSGAVAQVGTSGIWNREIANGDGYFSIYYSSLYPGEFLAPNAAYDIRISGTLGSCHYVWEMDQYVIWLPLGGYILEWDNGTRTLTSIDPGACQP